LAAEALQSLQLKRPTRSLRTQCERQEWSRQRLAVTCLVESTLHELFLALVIVANLIVFIFETDGRVANEDVRKWEFLSRFVFLPIYIVDLCLRVYVHQPKFYKNKWNVMDASLVISDLIVEGIALVFQDATNEVQIFSMLRVLRLCRLARFARVMVIFKELHMMLHAFLSAMKTMFWASCMLAVLLTLCSILAVEFVQPINAKLAARGDYGECARCERAFSTVMNANLTFVQQILAGDNWGRLSVPIIEEEPGLAVILISALVMINLGLLNLILTVIVNAATEARRNDKRLQADENLQRFEGMQRKLVRICAELDVNCDGFLSLEELVDALDTNPDFRDVCEALDIHKDDMEVIYAFLDSDGDGTVTYTEFVEQAFKIRQLDVNSFLVTLRGVVNRLSMDMRTEIRTMRHDFNMVSKAFRNGPTTSQSSLKVDRPSSTSSLQLSPRLQTERFKSSASDRSRASRPEKLSESEAVDADRHVDFVTHSLSSTHLDAGHEAKEKDGRGFYWAELDEELASLRQRLDASVADFVATFSKLHTHVASHALQDDTQSDSMTCASFLRPGHRPDEEGSQAAAARLNACSPTQMRMPGADDLATQSKSAHDSRRSASSHGRRKTETL